MIKRGKGISAFAIMISFAVFAIFMMGFASAASCNPVVSLVNQEPYPAVPGDYVKLVFQVSGLENSLCNYLSFQLVPNYPISFDPGVDSALVLRGGTYSGADYGSYIMVPYKVRVDPDALDGDNPIEVRYSTSMSPSFQASSEFNLAVNNTLTDFNVFVKDFNFATNQMTLEILNIGKSDVETLTVQLPPQENFTIKGPNMYVIGTLDSKDYSTASFEVSPNAGTLKMNIYYNDVTGTRRNTTASVYFDPTAFANRKTASSGGATGYIVLLVIVGGIVGFIFYRRYKKKRKKRLLRE